MAKRVVMVTGPVHAVPSPYGAAVESWIYEVSRRLTGYEPHVICPAHSEMPDTEVAEGVHYHRIRFGALYKRLFQKITRLDPSSYSKRAADIVREVGADIVHVHNNTNGYAPPLLEMVRGRATTVLHMHNVQKVDGVEVDGLAGCSRFIVDTLGTSVTARVKKEIYNGADTVAYRPAWEAQDARQRARKGLGIGADEFVVFFAGRISPEKGVDRLVSALEYLADIPDLRLVCVGDIPSGGGRNERVEYAGQVMESARRYGDRVIFTGVVERTRMPKIYHVGNVAVVPSNFDEPFGMVAIEAMASGLPLIASNRGGLREYIVDNDNGLFIDEADPARDIADKIRLIKSDAGLAERLSHSARRTVENRFTWERITGDLEGFYSSLI